LSKKHLNTTSLEHFSDKNLDSIDSNSSLQKDLTYPINIEDPLFFFFLIFLVLTSISFFIFLNKK